MADLETFVKKNPPKKCGPPCWACNLPVDYRVAVNEAKPKYSARTVMEWLKAEGVDGVTISKVERHWREHVR